MNYIVIETDGTPWSLSGWTLQYIQLDATTYGYKLVDPSGTVHTDSIHDGYFVHYNLPSVGELIKVIAEHRDSGVQAAIRKYNLKTQAPKSIKL